MLKIVTTHTEVEAKSVAPDCSPEELKHHQQLLDGYLQSHRIRNHTEKTIRDTKRLLAAWFSLHGTESRPLLTWEAMAPIRGRKRKSTITLNSLNESIQAR